PLSPHFLLLFSTQPSPPALHTLSLHDALPILLTLEQHQRGPQSDRLEHTRRDLVHPHGAVMGADISGMQDQISPRVFEAIALRTDRKSTRLNSSHRTISYAVFCLKKKKNKYHT